MVAEVLVAGMGFCWFAGDVIREKAFAMRKAGDGVGAKRATGEDASLVEEKNVDQGVSVFRRRRGQRNPGAVSKSLEQTNTGDRRRQTLDGGSVEVPSRPKERISSKE